MHFYDHSKFFEKWLRYTKDTPIIAFTSSYERSRTSFSFFLKIIEKALLNNNSNVTVTTLSADEDFMEAVRGLAERHIPRTDMNSLLLAIKLFRQCVMEMIHESGIKDSAPVAQSTAKAFDVIELTIASVFHTTAIQNLKHMLHTVSTKQAGSEPPVMRAVLAKLGTLTQAEMNVCELIVAKLSTKGIADKLNVSTATIQTHRKRIRKKLDIPMKSNLYSHLRYML